MYIWRLMVVWLRKSFRSIYATIYEHIMWSIFFMIRQKSPRKFLSTLSAFATGHFWRCSLLVVDCSAFHMNVKASNISDESVECGVASSWPLSSTEIIGHYNETFIHSNPTTQKWVRKPFGDDVMSVTVDNFLHGRLRFGRRFWISREWRNIHG